MFFLCYDLLFRRVWIRADGCMHTIRIVYIYIYMYSLYVDHFMQLIYQVCWAGCFSFLFCRVYHHPCLQIGPLMPMVRYGLVGQWVMALCQFIWHINLSAFVERISYLCCEWFSLYIGWWLIGGNQIMQTN